MKVGKYGTMAALAVILAISLAFAGSVGAQAKYWPPVGRIDNVYGDRHLFCSCLPVSDTVSDTEPA